MRELEAQAKALAGVFAELVKPLNDKIAELEKALGQIPAPAEIEYSALAIALKEHLPPALDEENIIEQLAKRIPAPIPGEKGKDAEPVDLDVLAKAAAELVQIPEVKDGKDGAPGESLGEEHIRPMVAALVADAVAAIPQPLAAKDGEDGRDAIHLEILPSIDEQKTYRRGTYAKHDGGLWRSFESTSGMRGWECIVEGIKSIAIEQQGERAFSVSAELSSGAVTEKSLTIPAQIYRGVFKAGEYEPGDVVTWGGSAWHCEEATSAKPGEIGSKGWTLAVKRGRDGKDGTNGKDMVSGVKIK